MKHHLFNLILNYVKWFYQKKLSYHKKKLSAEKGPSAYIPKLFKCLIEGIIILSSVVIIIMIIQQHATTTNGRRRNPSSL